LKPKSHKTFFKVVAKEADVHKDVVDDLITFYYSKVRKSLSELADSNISVAGLGTFSLRKRKLENYADRITKEVKEMNEAFVDMYKQ